ncbi:TnpV protein [Eubacterium ramulus]|nr:TnpV protein [Eubacterium ramulus]MSC94814.1 TnpV protein [Eubacterium ramulus]RYS96799.1 TnpV protein [Eubacterium ramulus]
MPVFKNEDNGTWYVMARYVNWKGERKQKCKRGFATKKEAQEWERMFQLQNSSDLDMSFEAFTELYINDVKNRLKENTYLADIDRQAEEMFSRLVKQMAECEGVTEQLKAENQLEWVGKMNNIRSRAVEIIDVELICV